MKGFTNKPLCILVRRSSPVVSVLDSGSDGPGSSPGWGMTPEARRFTHIALSSRIGCKTVGPVSCTVGVGDPWGGMGGRDTNCKALLLI